MISGIKQDERGQYYYTILGPNGWPLIRYCKPPCLLRVVGKFKPGEGEETIHLQRFTGEAWVRV